MSHRVVLVPGDGVGPELVAATRRAVDATGVDIDWEVREAGQSARVQTGSPLPPETVAAIRDAGVALKGATTSGGPGPGPPSANNELRRALDLHMSVRPARNMGDAHPAFDLVLETMTQEDLYAGASVEAGSDRARALRQLVLSAGDLQSGEAAGPAIIFMTRLGAEDVVRTGLAWARAHRRSRVTVIHRADEQPVTDGVFLQAARALSREFSDLTIDALRLEAALDELDRQPGTLDVLLAPTAYVAPLTELIASLVGGVGMMPRASLGPGAAIFDTVHGSALAHAGRDTANPIGQMLAGVLLLRHLGEDERADRLEAAVEGTVREGRLTRDVAKVGHAVSTTAVTDEVVARVGGVPRVRLADEHH